MEEETKTPDPEAMSAENAARPVQSSSANETTKPEIPIARNVNPAGVSTARMVGDLPVGVTAGQSGSVADTKSPPGAELLPAEYPIARNANPTGVSTSLTRE
jgi:hypothetical protein